jgi:hypothetical protein
MDELSISLIKNVYLIAHYNAADLSLLEDLSEYIKDLNIVNKSFVTISKPLKFEESYVYIRDTQLLTPSSQKSLSALSDLYGDLTGVKKGRISRDDLEHMDEFLKRDQAGFEAYALADAIIALTHAVTLERVNFDAKRIGIPITLSSLGRTMVLDKWSAIFQQYFPYQISGDCLMGNADEVQTPKGLFATGEVGLSLPLFIGNYKGGRNESFMYGCEEKERTWYDYDLTSAYTTGMAHLSLPAYPVAKHIEPDSVKELTPEQLLNGYLILNAEFKFPDHIKYPSIPCFIDKTTTVYPLQGQCILTGPEYLLARSQECDVKIKTAYFIPATTREKHLNLLKMSVKVVVQPFQEIIQQLQKTRREYPKGHVMNALYKELTNSIYGNVVRGMSNKKTFDTKSGKMLRVSGTELSNPILAS